MGSQNSIPFQCYILHTDNHHLAVLACAEVGCILSPRGAGIVILDIHFSKCDSRILSINFPSLRQASVLPALHSRQIPLVVVCHWWPGLFSIHGLYAVVVPIFCWICISYLFDLRYQCFGWVYLCHNLQQILAFFGRHQTKFQTDTSHCDLPRLVTSSAETLPAMIDVAPIAVLRNGGHGPWKETFGAVRTLERFKNGEQSSGVVVEVRCLVKLLQNYVRFCKISFALTFNTWQVYLWFR